MDIGKVIKIHSIPEPQEPKRIPIGPEKNPFEPRRIPGTGDEVFRPIPVPDWPTKVPEKVEA